MMASQLCLYEPGSGLVSEILRTDRHIEAPNWSPSGDVLVVNGEGRLFRVDLAAPALVPIDTGFARACNNDHGFAPDGRSLVISDSSATADSCIYRLPAVGGAPVRVTDFTPSWWHGWSPDGLTLAYAARRDGVFWIATIAAAGGKESLLIGGDGAHYDGPDYTPDGRWIWFNATRGGSMQLWRMQPDGANAEQMTDDERVNWFPHPAPAGGLVLYLSYEPGTEGHPAGRDVELRLLDPTTGVSRTAVRLFGGQGSINVPCWSPDGRHFAFMRYTRH